MRSTSQLRSVWAPACQLRPSARFTFWSGVPVTVDGRIVPALQALDDCLRRHGYRPKEGQTWGYSCRKITGGSGYSLHAYGTALDVNSLSNPYGPRLVTDMPIAMVEEIEAIQTEGGHRVWGWGGRYSRNKDAMHFEVVASPAELATGIRATQEDDLTTEQARKLDDLHAAMGGVVDRLDRVEKVTAAIDDRLKGTKPGQIGDELDGIRRDMRIIGAAVGAKVES